MNIVLKKENKVFRILLVAFQVALAAFFAYMLFTAIKDNILACMERFPREYRESANLSLARGFIDGKNIYELPSSGPIPVYVYGFINPLLAAGITKITGMNLLNSFYFIYLITTVLFCVLLSYEVYSLIKNKITGKFFIYKKENTLELGNILLFISLILITYTLTFRIGHITTIPDTLGMVVGMIILMLTRRSKSFKSVIVISILVVLEFYIKAYFLFFAAPVFFYFLIKNRKLMGWYILFCVLIGLASIFIVNAIFPLYFIENIYFEFIEQFLNVYVDESIVDAEAYERNYMISQFVKLFVKYNCVLVIGLIISFTRIFRFIKDLFTKVKFEFDFDTLAYDICIIIAIPLLVVLGKNDGAYMSYHFQLLMPSVLIVAYDFLIPFYNCKIKEILCFKKFVEYINIIKIDKAIYKGVILFLIFVSTYKSYVAFGRVSLLTKEQEANWDKVEKICLDAYDSNKLIFAGNLTNAVIIDRRSYYSDFNGHTYINYATKEEADATAENKLFNTIFADLDEMYYYAADYNKETENNFKESKYDIIIADEESVYEKVNINDYNSEQLNLDMGQFDCNVTIFTKK